MLVQVTIKQIDEGFFISLPKSHLNVLGGTLEDAANYMREFILTQIEEGKLPEQEKFIFDDSGTLGYIDVDFKTNEDIAKILTISTSHIKRETSEMLDNVLKGIRPDTYDDYDLDRLIVYNKDDCGYFIYIDEKTQYFNLPEDLFNCINYCIDLDCDILCLDCDGSCVEELDKFDWGDY